MQNFDVIRGKDPCPAVKPTFPPVVTILGLRQNVDTVSSFEGEVTGKNSIKGKEGYAWMHGCTAGAIVVIGQLCWGKEKDGSCVSRVIFQDVIIVPYFQTFHERFDKFDKLIIWMH